MSVLLFSVLCCATAWAQGTAQISGTVQDQSGAILPGVEITVTQAETGVARSTSTNQTGSYVLPNLAIGPYRLEAALPGFRTFVQRGIVLQVNSSPVINPVLEVGEVTAVIEVEANAALVETRNVSIGQVIENERILELPLNGRQVTDLITLAGAAVARGTSADGTGGGAFINIGGGLSYGVDYALDGANHRNFITGANMPIPFPDALQEFNVSASGGRSNQGANAGVSAVTKAGTNELHGSLFAFVRNDLYSARPYFAGAGSTLKRNQFGGTAGGRIVRNKLFYFGGYQGTTHRQDPADREAFFPTPAMMAGDWTAFASPACAGRPITLRAPFVNNRIDPALYSRVSVNLVNRLWEGSKPVDECGRVRFGTQNIRDEHQFLSKVDYQWSDQHSLFGRYFAMSVDTPSAFTFDEKQLLNTGSRYLDNLSQSVTLGDTYVFGPNTVNAARVSYNRHKSTTSGVSFFSACDLGINVYCGYNPKRMGTFAVVGAFTIGSTAAEDGQYYNSDSFQFSNDLSLVRGAHQLSLGGNAVWYEYYQTNYFNTAAVYRFTSQFTGLSMGDFLLGRLNDFRQGAPSEHLIHQWVVALYANDTWKATPRLTVNLGVRWEPYLPQTVSNGRVYSFDMDRFRAGTKSTQFVNAPAGFSYPGDPGFVGLSGINKKWAHFAPRVGLAYDLTGDGRTSLRASYGYSYNYISGQWRLPVSNSAPWTGTAELPFPVGGLADPWQGIGNPFPFVLNRETRFPPGADLVSQNPDLKTPAMSSWNLSVQRQFGPDWVVSASYIGNASRHVWTYRSLNHAVYIPGSSTVGNTAARRVLSLLNPEEARSVGKLADTDDGGTMNYHAMLLSVQRRMSRGVTASANYTRSRCLGDFTRELADTPDVNFVYTDPNNRSFDRGACGSDRRHIFNLTALAETPRFANTTARRLASGWRLSLIHRRSSGAPLNVISGTDVALTGIINQRPNQVLDNPYTGDSGPLDRYLNPAAFTPPAVGTLGNSPRNGVVGPRTWTFDMALSRTFLLTEAYRLEVRAQAYNVFNSFRAGDPADGEFLANLGSSTFGQIRTALDPRILELALKFAF
ncbi:MAG: hypothetical protein A3H28_13385 [Acidobacteria bacterium RIFCSPLOWO2_02_FULL_61_28]|nr:MAG: hypothetical protein A3H28_13385 [Acidobacteria bacterium RIFCSPLOWO2_02_FULL_61_28]